jgi:hypothetical protein
VFDPGQVSRDRPGPDRDHLLVARLGGIAQRHARWGTANETQKATGAAELREVADGRGDLLAEVAGISLGAAERKGEEYQAQAQAVEELCRLAGADESLIQQWAEEGRRRAAAAGKPPFSQPAPRTPRRP